MRKYLARVLKQMTEVSGSS